MREQGGLSRREFLARTGATAALAALGPLGARRRSRTLREGLYSDRFTYRHGDTIRLHAALHGGGPVDLDLVRWDTPVGIRAARHRVRAGLDQNTLDPGTRGARFAPVLELPAGDLEPGLYQAEIAPSACLEPHRTNRHNPYVSHNTFCRFVVTNAVPGARSRLLWVHGTLTGVCYGSFGGRSIYGSDADPAVASRSVSWERPGLDISSAYWQPLAFLRQHGYEFEYVDSLALAQAPPGFLDPYDLVLCVGQLEYLPHAFLEQLARHLDGGGNLFVCSDEFAIFRVRLDAKRACLTTYKYDWEREDPVARRARRSAKHARHVAGVGMNLAGTFWETEIAGQTCWAAHRIGTGQWIDLPLYPGGEAGWLLDGTGLRAGDALPRAMHWFASGNLVAFDDAGRPFVVERERTRTPEGTSVWAAAASPDGRAWWLADGRDVGRWPLVPGHATATLQQRPSGAQVVSFPALPMVMERLDEPVYQRLLLNVVERLSRRASPRPSAAPRT